MPEDYEIVVSSDGYTGPVIEIKNRNLPVKIMT